jgi:hypothetical protein
MLEVVKPTAPTVQAGPSSDAGAEARRSIVARYFSLLNSGTPARWNLTTVVCLFGLIVIWAALLRTTWAAWGNLSIDSGHEMYVPTLLSEGKMLYRDVWFMYLPVAPYFNSYLFRLFGVHLNVLYLAGSFSALGSAAFLYLTGMRLGSWVAGWMAGAVLLLEAFQPSLFCFPLPYSFSAVYGCLTATCFLWMIVHASSSNGRAWVFGAGIAAAAALLIKLEFGAACYASLGILLVLRGFRQQSWKALAKDSVAILPGLLLCAAVIRWMVSIRGVDFILQENFETWPTSYFMKVYGKFWLASTGFSLAAADFAASAQRTLLFLGIWQGFALLVRWKRELNLLTVSRIVLFLLAAAHMMTNLTWREALLAVFFPRDMVPYAAIAALVFWVYLFRHPELDRTFALAMVLTFSSLLAFRILLKTVPSGYPIYYNGPAVLSLYLIVLPLLRSLEKPRRFLVPVEALVCALCLASVALHVHEEGKFPLSYGSLVTDRGTIRTWPGNAVHYQEAIDFMKEKNALGESVLSIPEDTSLYFLSHTHCPTRVYIFSPGLLAPGKMTDELIAEIERKHVRYLLWSNRIFPEYGALRFGIDFDQTFGTYLVKHYRRVGSVVKERVSAKEWTAFIWERKAESELP